MERARHGEGGHVDPEADGTMWPQAKDHHGFGERAGARGAYNTATWTAGLQNSKDAFLML